MINNYIYINLSNNIIILFIKNGNKYSILLHIIFEFFHRISIFKQTYLQKISLSPKYHG